ncbi:MAG: phage protease [Rikenellaceae bacterium]
MKFILNDETIENSYGFYLMNAGRRRERFDANPVMLNEHRHSEVIGRWENIRIEGGQLLADSVFDVDDELGAKISGKVERGFLKGCSLGIRILKARSQEVAPDEWRCYVTEWEPVEASVCAIPSNASALSVLVYDHQTNKPVAESQLTAYLDEVVKLSMVGVATNVSLNNNDNMTFNTTFLESLNLQEGADSAAIELSVVAIIAERDNATAQVATLQTEIGQLNQTRIESMVDLAVKSGKILPTQKSRFMKLAEGDYDSVREILDGMQPRTSLRATLSTQQTSAAGGREISAAEWDRLHHSGELEALSLEDPTTFALLQAAKYPVM